LKDIYAPYAGSAGIVATDKGKAHNEKIE